MRQVYIDENIPIPYPAANKQLQLRLTQFVSNGENSFHDVTLELLFFVGLLEGQSMSLFDKVNSKRVYSLEKHNDLVHLMMIVKEKDETS